MSGKSQNNALTFSKPLSRRVVSTRYTDPNGYIWDIVAVGEDDSIADLVEKRQFSILAEPIQRDTFDRRQKEVDKWLRDELKRSSVPPRQRKGSERNKTSESAPQSKTLPPIDNSIQYQEGEMLLPALQMQISLANPPSPHEPYHIVWEHDPVTPYETWFYVPRTDKYANVNWVASSSVEIKITDFTPPYGFTDRRIGTAGTVSSYNADASWWKLEVKGYYSRTVRFSTNGDIYLP
jgi:hypothetical protein